MLFDAASRGRYATDASIYQIMPVGVLVPKSDRDVAVALEIARELGVPVLPRGAGTSQCGQTTGAALVIDTTKHLRRIVEVDAERRTATVEPGLVLDHLNAQLKPHGLWFPVDVSTSAQATLGGMAGNNSCGSRSIAYGNMVHNVLGIDARLSDGAAVDFGPVRERRRGRAAAIAGFVRDLALSASRRDRGALAEGAAPRRRLQPRHLPSAERKALHRRRQRQSRAPAGRRRGHARLVARADAEARAAAGAKVLGVVNFPTFRAAMEAAQHIVTLGPTAVELVDRTMIDLALANPAFGDDARRRCVGEPAAILLVEFAGDARRRCCARLADWSSCWATWACREASSRWPTTRRRRTSGRCARPASTS